MSSGEKRRVAVSYSWKEEAEGPNAGAVERFCAALKKVGVEVVRDIDRLKHGECISTFMRSIGASDFLGVFLSDAYLRSPNCMYELLVAWQRSMDNPTEFRQRVKAWVMPGSQAIHKVETRFGYLDFWKAERERRSALIQKAATDGLSPASLEEFRRIKQFTEHVDEILCFFSDTLSPGSEDEFTKWIQAEFSESSAQVPGVKDSGTVQATPPEEPQPAPTPPTLEDLDLPRKLREVFGTQYDALSRILESNQPLREELVRRFGLTEVPREQVTAALMLHIHFHFLEAFGEFVDLYREETRDRKALVELISGVLFLAMCPYYASNLRQGADPDQIAIAETARQGIAEILICWTRGKKGVQITSLSSEKSLGVWETTPQMGLSEIKRVLMSKLGIDPNAPDADLQLDTNLQAKKHGKTPVSFVLSDSDERLITQLTAPGSPLRNLLLLIKKKEHTINPRGEKPYEMRVEAHLDELRNLLNVS